MNAFKLMRIVILLSILFVIVVGTWITERRMASWDRPLLVTVYPIVADGSESTRRYAESITEESFRDVNEFFERESLPYGFTLHPAVRVQIAEVSNELPPPTPDLFNTAGIAWWSLKMRWWTWMKSLSDDLIKGDIQMFMIYRGQDAMQEVGISVGMRKGKYGIVRAVARADRNPFNLVVFTHELLHVLGASDKYVLTTGEPIYPEGYAEPERRPLFPQPRAEIMGGRIPQTAYASIRPRSLQQCKIGKVTAAEIGFFNHL